jgi:metal-sulfur cluster biosynthetic enzyme
VDEVTVECLWEEAWTPDRLSPTAREALGFEPNDPPEGRMHVRAQNKAEPGAEALDERRLEQGRLCLSLASIAVTELGRDKFGSWWGGWRFFKRFWVEETSGLSKRGEPIHLEAVFAADQVRDMAREIRLVDEATATEIPCQIYDQGEEGATRTCRLVFLADVPAGVRKSYLLLHGNFSPACWSPFYETDLTTRGEGYALQVENSVYRARLSPVMGQLRNLEFKGGGKTRLGWQDPSPINWMDADNDPQAELDIAWHGEDSCIHWNPDFRNQLRYRMTNWPEPPHYHVVQGPLCTVVRRWGYPVCPTHPARDQSVVQLDVTYIFYNGLPYFTMESRLTVEQETDILVVRNDEWLFAQAFTHSLRMQEGGEIEKAPAATEVTFTENPALVGFFHEQTGDAFASLRLAYDARGFSGAYNPRALTLGTTGYGNQIWSRDVFHAPGGTELAIQPGATVGEYNAYLCYNLEASGGQQQAADWYARLRCPLKATVEG